MGSAITHERKENTVNGTKKLVVGGVIAGGLMIGGAALVLGAGIAHSEPGSSIYGGGSMGDHDAYSVWNQISAYSDASDVTVDTARQFAMTTCQSFAAGLSEGRIVAAMVDEGIDADDARFAVHGAAFHFCPAYYG